MDLTGLTGSAIQMIFKNPATGARFVGTGTSSTPTISNPGTANAVSSWTYTPSAADVGLGNVGLGWLVQAKFTYLDTTFEFSLPGAVDILAPL